MSVRFGIIGSGRIAEVMVEAMHGVEEAVPFSVAAREVGRARLFAERHRVGKAAAGFEALLADPAVDAVYVCPVHTCHFEWAEKALLAGKHVLCEKPLTLTPGEAEHLYALAVRRGLLLMEGYMYRWHPQTAKLVELLEAGAIGPVRMIRSAFCFREAPTPGNRLFDAALAGGAIWDVGGYPVSLVSLIAGKTVECCGLGEYMANGVDLAWCGTLRTERGVLAQIACACDRAADQALYVYGDAGTMVIPDPWVCDRHRPQDGRIVITAPGGAAEEIVVPADRTSFRYEIEAFCALLRNGVHRVASPGVTPEESVAIVAVQHALCRNNRRPEHE